MFEETLGHFGLMLLLYYLDQLFLIGTTKALCVAGLVFILDFDGLGPFGGNESGERSKVRHREL